MGETGYKEKCELLFELLKMQIQLITNLGLKMVSASSKHVEKGSAHLFPNVVNHKLVYKSEVSRFKCGSV